MSYQYSPPFFLKLNRKAKTNENAITNVIRGKLHCISPWLIHVMNKTQISDHLIFKKYIEQNLKTFREGQRVESSHRAVSV